MKSGSEASVLIVEDDSNIAELIRLYLEKHGFRSVIATGGLEALNILSSRDPGIDLVILDLMLPAIDGWEVCRWIRQHSSLPVIILTAKGELQSRLRGFDLGADDYIVKPFDPLELVARVRAVLRRTGNKPQHIELPGMVIDFSYMVKVCGERVDFIPREAELLYFLASHPNRVFTRDSLLRQLWGFHFKGNTRTVDVHINRIREKLEPFPCAWRIETVWGVGYKFVLKGKDAEVEHFS
ncbi:MAG: response regulator transcription factor [Desulfofundulus sp.]